MNLWGIDIKIYEIGTGYSSISATISAATEIVIEQLTKSNIINHIGIDENKIVKISNRVNSKLYYPLTPQEKEAAKAEYGLANKK